MSSNDGNDNRFSFDVRVWAIKPYQRKRSQTYGVRWTVGGKPHHKTFRTRALADAFRASLLTATRQGEPFEVSTGLPVAMLPTATGPTWYDHACAFVDSKWPSLAPKSREAIANALTTITIPFLTDGPGRPETELIREALYQWAFHTVRRNAGPPSDHLTGVIDWIAAHSLPVTALTEPRHVRLVLDSLATTSRGKPAAANTIKRWRVTLRSVIGYAIELGHLATNPLTQVKWVAPKVGEVVDPRVVVNHDQARALLAAVRQQGKMGEHLVAFFACMYYAAMRPGEVIALRIDNLAIPEHGWGELRLDSSDPSGGSTWTDTGRQKSRQLKHRPANEVRPVPCPPQLIELLQEHLRRYGVTPDGRLFRASRGGRVSDHAYGRVWQAARQEALSPAEVASPLAARPYDLRHAAVSTWLNAGVDAPQVAEWAGHSLDVLLKVYAKCIAGRGDIHRRRIEEMLGNDTATEPNPPESEEDDQAG